MAEGTQDRRQVRDELLASERFRTGLKQLAADLGRDEAEVAAEAARYAEEMVTGWSRLFVNLGVRLGRFNFRRGYDPELDIDPAQLERLRTVAGDKPLVFLPSHKSNLDTLVMNVALHDNDLPRTCVFGGSNMSFWPIGPIFQQSGTAYIRRNTRDKPVYTYTLREYVGLLIERRASMQFYVEGGRSRTGKLLPPKLGLLTYVADAFRQGRAEDVVLVPVSIAYDQLQEVNEFAREAQGGSKSAESIGWLVRAFREQRGRYGKIYVRVAEPLSLREALGPAGDEAAERLALQKVGIEVSRRINEVTPITATSLVTLALLGAQGRALTVDQIRAAVHDPWRYARRCRFPVTDQVALDTVDGVRAALAELESHDVVVRYADGPETVYVIGPDQHLAAAFYRNTIIHFFVIGAIAQAGLARVAMEQTADPLATFWDAVLALRDLLKFEFFFEPRDEFRATIAAELSLHDHDWERHVAAGSPAVQNLLEDIRPLTAHTVLRSFLESYSVMAATIATQNGRDVGEKELLRRCKSVGRQYQLQQRIHSPESLASPLFKNALQLADSRGLLSGPATDEDRRRLGDEIRRVIRDLDLVELLATTRVQELINAEPVR
jgi:glycerol-3-phosphate O-acyltransferase